MKVKSIHLKLQQTDGTIILKKITLHIIHHLVFQFRTQEHQNQLNIIHQISNVNYQLLPKLDNKEYQMHMIKLH